MNIINKCTHHLNKNLTDKYSNPFMRQTLNQQMERDIKKIQHNHHDGDTIIHGKRRENLKGEINKLYPKHQLN